MSIKLEKDYVLVELFISEAKESNSIIVMEDEKMKEVRRGRVIAVNEDYKDLANGEIVWFLHDAGYRLRYEAKNCVIMHSNEILGVEED
jgi:co-chaperonin GroES (HSP10)